MAPLSIYSQLQLLSGEKRPIVRLVIAVLSLACVLVVGLAARGAWKSHSEQLKDAEVSTSNIARVLAAHAEAAITVADLVLEDIVERSERSERDGIGGFNQDRLRRHLASMSVRAGQLHGIFVYDEQGDCVASSLDGVVKENISDQGYFKEHRMHLDQQISINTPVRDHATGIWVIPFSRRLQYANGSFAGVAKATMRLDLFEEIYANLNVGGIGTILLTLDDGTMFYRRPFKEEYIGQNLSSGVVMRAYRTRGPVGTDMLTAKIDGVTRLYSYRHLDSFPLIVAAAVSKEEIYAGWWRTTLKQLAGLLVFIMLLIWCGIKLLRQLAIRENLEKQLHAVSDGLAQANKDLSELALKDGLTQLANRRALDGALEREFSRACRNNAQVSLIMLDVDWFKKFNDTYGHQGGDKCLQQIAAALSDQVTRQTDLAARYGGEEFAMLLPETDGEGAATVAERIQKAVSALEMVHACGLGGKVTVSIGIATFDPSLKTLATPADLIKAADDALYHAKHLGRNQVCSSRGRFSSMPAEKPRLVIS